MRSYRYLDDLTTADVAFEARGGTAVELLAAAADALLGVMLEDLDALHPALRRPVALRAESLELLLFALLQELIFLKDAEQLLLRAGALDARRCAGGWRLDGTLLGEPISPARHALATDVKAVTLHRFHVERCGRAWVATVVLDV